MWFERKTQGTTVGLSRKSTAMASALCGDISQNPGERGQSKFFWKRAIVEDTKHTNEKTTSLLAMFSVFVFWLHLFLTRILEVTRTNRFREKFTHCYFVCSWFVVVLSNLFVFLSIYPTNHIHNHPNSNYVSNFHQPQVFFDLMREIRSRKTEDSKTTSGRAKDKCKRRKIKCSIL